MTRDPEELRELRQKLADAAAADAVKDADMLLGITSAPPPFAWERHGASEQERGDWENAWPSDGEQCPDCKGQVETQEFGYGRKLHVMAWCVGLNGMKQEDADADDTMCGCGWSGEYWPNKKAKEGFSEA